MLAGAAAVSILAVALSAPTAQSAAQAMQVISVPTPAVQPASAPNCKLQTWPYIDRSCAQQEANNAQAPRAVRVISTDRVAPATLNAGPVVLASQTEMAEPTSKIVGSGETVASVEPGEAVPMPKPRPLQTAAATRRDIPDNVRRALTPPIRAEDDDGVQVRAYALPDGRRVTVYRYENPAERAVISRNDAYERRQVRLPFLSLFD